MKQLGFLVLFFAMFACQNKVDSDQKMDMIKYIDRKSGEIHTENVPNQGMLNWLYGAGSGKLALHLLFKRKLVSSMGGWYMNTQQSAKRIPGFIAEHNIDITEFQDADTFKTFNQFFYRKLKANVRPIGEHLVSPADGKILVFPTLNDVQTFFIKGSEFTLERFLQNPELTKKYSDGSMAIVRLAPPDYHRYHFPASGIASESTKINGYYYSVSPLALRGSLEIFCENKREYSTLATKEYGDILIMDVGATMVGSIFQTYSPGLVKKGDEKGYFAFGGSTLVLLFEKGKIRFDKDLLTNTQKGMETTIHMGEDIGLN
ncbi:MAG TPA: phosphatidylserine decarboxylase [Draconibacterium sp.]|nr:phosphatidylserine decarboxylase [Draconibacterium sp.]